MQRWVVRQDALACCHVHAVFLEKLDGGGRLGPLLHPDIAVAKHGGLAHQLLVGGRLGGGDQAAHFLRQGFRGRGTGVAFDELGIGVDRQDTVALDVELTVGCIAELARIASNPRHRQYRLRYETSNCCFGRHVSLPFSIFHRSGAHLPWRVTPGQEYIFCGPHQCG